MASRRRPSARRSRSRRQGPLRLPSVELPSVGPEVARSLLGLTLLVLGAVTLIALLLPGQGTLTNWWNDAVGPWFGSMRWMLPFLLIGGGWYLEWGGGQRPDSGWTATLVGMALTYVSILGIVEILDLYVLGRRDPLSGGRLGRAMAELFVPLVSGPGAFVILLALAAIGLLVAFNLPPRALTRPVVKLARWIGEITAASVRPSPANPSDTPAAERAPTRAKPKVAVGPGAEATPGQTGLWSREANDDLGPIPPAVASTAPTSATFAPARVASGTATAGNGSHPGPEVPRPVPSTT